MKTSFIKFSTVLLMTLLTVSCRKYVEVDQFNDRTLRNTTDYQFLMNNRDAFKSGFILPAVVNDDMATGISAHQATWSSEIKNAYIWAEYYYLQGQSDIGWSNLYKQIYTCNEVLFGVLSSKNGTEAQKREIYAEALVQRAYAFLMLANQYGEIYNPENAARQIGIPMLTTPDLYQPLNRSNLDVIYDKIIKDLEEAAPSLPNTGSHNGHPGKAAVYALLSRCFLYMRDFEQSGVYADKALTITSALVNLQDYENKMGSYPMSVKDPEILLFKITAGTFRSELNTELLNLFAAGDLRYSLFTGTQFNVPGRSLLRSNFTSFENFSGIGIPEVILNRAEVYAREGNISKTLEMLNTLRKNRFRAADYQDLVITSTANLLPAVLEERRRELMGTGLRWFDQRRLSLDPGLAKAVSRTFEGQTYILTPGSNKYIFPIAQGLLDLNPEIQQSPR